MKTEKRGERKENGRKVRAGKRKRKERELDDET
jgi:hypothetical protein